MNDKFVHRSIAIPLNKNFRYVHATHNENEKKSDDLFVGRKHIIKKLVSLLKSENRKRGSYLITGYRGVGKTSVINIALGRYTKHTNENKDNKDKPLIVRINLGDNSQLTPLNIYFSIVNILREEICNNKQSSIKNSFKLPFIPTTSLSPQNIVNLFCASIFIMGVLSIWNYLMPDQMIHSIFSVWLVIILFSLPVLLQSLEWDSSLRENPELGLLREIDELIERMSNEISEARSTGLNYRNFNYGWSRNKTKLPINAREAEDQLSRILQKLNKKGIKVIFVLDEIDKLSDYEELSEVHYSDTSRTGEHDKISQINTLLGSLKNFVTTAHATFFFISGRETLDRYYSEKGSPNSLYESLFDQVFEVPSLLTDKGERHRGTQLTSLIEEYVCRRINIPGGNKEYTLNKFYTNVLIEIKNQDSTKTKEEAELQARFYINSLRSFIHFLTFHSWGNPKRLNTIFESFIVPKEELSGREKEIRAPDSDSKAEYWLLFNNSDKHSFALTSEITTLFQHQLSREVSRISDKLTVSVFSSLHFILKLHTYGFSRETLHRMSETINIYRSPELNTIVDDLLTHVFKPYIRKIRNGMYRFRFHSGFEQELRYISHVFELESASYNFSLNSMKHVKQFFKDVLANGDKEDTGVVSRVHIILGDMSAIEQSYNAASEHYNIATRIIRSTLHEIESAANRVTLINYIEVLLKQGDLSEHNHNYGRAAALYSEAENIAKKCIVDFQLSDYLQKGDSKWDLLKQPYWATKYLSLKRSPRPFKDANEIRMPDRPDYLYSEGDPRFYNYTACLFFFLGDAISAARTYCTTLRLTNQNADLLLLNERTSYLRNYAKIGIVESTSIYYSRQLLERYRSNQSDCSNKKAQDILYQLLEYTHEQKIISSDGIPDQKIEDVMKDAVEDYENNRLYTSAVITCIKIICYFTAILDSFDSHTFDKDNQKKEELIKFTNNAHELIISIGKKAARCIDKARQLESTQGIKTLMIHDLKKTDSENKDFTKLIDWLLLEHNSEQTHPINEEISWQQSLWTQKLASSLIWAKYVIGKIKGNNTHQEDNWLPDLSFISVRPTIVIRWIHARHMLHRHVEKKLAMTYNFKKCSVRDILNKINNVEVLSLTNDGAILTKHLYQDEVSIEDTPDILKKAYEISRYLYFAVHNSRIISRKNIDLIFPRLSQIYYIQWKLLTNLIAVILLKAYKDPEVGNKLNSIRNISFLLQKWFINFDEKLAPQERIPPSYFDYEYIHLRLEESLDSSTNLVDRTSRSHMSIFQHKYFCHDDHSDQEFHMDYTLAYMFTPMALCYKDEIVETNDLLINAVNHLKTR
jgi:Cdc6-like AAA superfamily ATPase